MYMISLIEKELNKKAKINFMDIQPGDVEKTSADISHSTALLDYKPRTKISEGIPKFIAWYKKYKKS